MYAKIVDQKYLQTNNFCLSKTMCKVFREEKLSIGLIGEKHFPKTAGNFLKNFTGIVRFKRNNETHYVKSILTGGCLLQVFVFEKQLDQSELINSVPIYSSEILTRDKNLQAWMNNYLNGSESLLNLTDNNRKKIFKKINHEIVIDLELKKLPELPARKKSPPTMSSAGLKLVSWNKLIPGLTIDMTELNNNGSLVTESIFDESFVHDREILNFEASKVDATDDQLRLNRINSLLQSQSCPAVVLNNRNGKQTLSFFECKLEQESYGVDKKYLDEQYFLMDGRLCHVGRRLALKTDQFYVINLDSDDFDSNIGNNVFVGENILLRRGSGTHYVSAVHFGDCLYQAEVLHLYQSSKNTTITQGRLLSASGNTNFENWAEKIINGTKSKLGLRQIYIDEKLQENLFEGFKKDQLLSIELVPLFKKHPVPKKPIFKKLTSEI